MFSPYDKVVNLVVNEVGNIPAGLVLTIDECAKTRAQCDMYFLYNAEFDVGWWATESAIVAFTKPVSEFDGKDHMVHGLIGVYPVTPVLHFSQDDCSYIINNFDGVNDVYDKMLVDAVGIDKLHYYMGYVPQFSSG